VAEADAEHRFAFISFDCCLDTLASLVTHFSVNVCGVDRWFLAGCELIPDHPIIFVQALVLGSLRVMHSGRHCTACPKYDEEDKLGVQ
jgi:hypothetical protein